MSSLYDELAEKLARDPSVTKRSGPRQDIGLLLFAARDDIAALWRAAERLSATDPALPAVPAASATPTGSNTSAEALAEAVDRLRPLFGER